MRKRQTKPVRSKLAKLRAALAEGEASGDVRSFDRAAFAQRLKTKWRRVKKA